MTLFLCYNHIRFYWIFIFISYLDVRSEHDEKRVLITIPLYGGRLNNVAESLEKLGYYVDWKPADSYTESDTIKNGRGYHAIIASSEPYSKTVLEDLSPTLKVISRFGVGYDNVDIHAVTKLGIAVTTTPGTMSGGVAEHALAMMLALDRKLMDFNNNMKAGIWDKSQLGTQLEGSTVGLVWFLKYCAASGKVSYGI